MVFRGLASKAFRGFPSSRRLEADFLTRTETFQQCRSPYPPFRSRVSSLIGWLGQDRARFLLKRHYDTGLSLVLRDRRHQRNVSAAEVGG